ncbi:MAG: pyridoxal phosphate-dependent aminotransferase [Paludibacter sp.]|nr:pyridoxal phosphate-dependent aminotransferase [Bacteroidales bacterium]MCM1069041.1 pyridoxal phosphate-dependent aminotransferase [Prevotella sp.]MCM1354702.1 pyridoxal phosphate-dependent aminotransferase [Bacteroides sp.]MCM1443532.1 pyridoxal phosphate-dependent aminotransferase [Muribaculum sp.]MCM1481597.1 pyridoxal phosphate-dependent aminotransferase [Paludibacter sp.]
MQYDFDTPISRRNTNSYKWDSAADEHVLPMWVADMDFQTAPAIVDALQQRVAHGIFGYTRVPDSYYKAVADWFARRHGWNIEHDWIIYTSGVVPALSAVIKALTLPGEKVLVQTPVYNCFFSSIRNNGCTMVSSPLVAKGDTYIIDYEDLERKAADPQVKLMLLCNPHNPAGRVWTREELFRIGNICIRNGVTVISDEIHCELVFPNHYYTPFASLSEEFRMHSVTCISPSKAFNIAGLQIANIVCADAARRAKIDRSINDNEVCDVNPFGVIATQAAYNEGEEWLNQLIRYLYDNYQYMQEVCCAQLPDFPLLKLEGTYLVWMDCRALGIPSEELEKQLIADVGLWLNAGTMYGTEGEGFMRWNIACPRSTLRDGLQRFIDFVKSRTPQEKD